MTPKEAENATAPPEGTTGDCGASVRCGVGEGLGLGVGRLFAESGAPARGAPKVAPGAGVPEPAGLGAVPKHALRLRSAIAPQAD